MAERCDYQGYEFGARYLDSYCFEGRLMDADSDYEPGDDIPCPQCRVIDALDHYVGFWGERGTAYSAWSLVEDIRANRGFDMPNFTDWLVERFRDAIVHAFRVRRFSVFMDEVRAWIPEVSRG